MKTGLVLEGGAQRAIYTAGVLDVFMENGITFDGVIAVSVAVLPSAFVYVYDVVVLIGAISLSVSNQPL